jgi:energy-coupling factor transporter ATP-binding protein EcfA2
MLLSEIYGIKSRYTRSTRIDADLSVEFFNGLLFHATAEKTLNTLSNEFSNKKRAFTLTGPYGSGKSTIALLLSGLLTKDQELCSLTKNIIGNSLFEKYRSSFKSSSKGYLIIRALGGLNDPIEMLVESIAIALQEQGLKQELKSLQNSTIENEADFIEFYDVLHKKLSGKVDGVILIHDELGKSLEHINRNDGDLHLFQEIGERISRYELPSIYIGLLHQGFSEYAREKNAKTRAEWAKVQGRFIDILYQVSTDEIMSLVSDSIHIKNTTPSNTASAIQSTKKQIINSYAREDLVQSLSFKKNIENIGPLHPYVASILGVISRRQFSQNERSVFSFLGSMEPNSLKLYLESTSSDTNTPYSLYNLWDFLEYNLEFHILPSSDGKLWSEAKDALNRARIKCVSPIALITLKTIALLNLFGSLTHLYAEINTLKLALIGHPEHDIETTIKELESNSLITYKSHINSYAIFAGSDIDIPSLLEKYTDNIEEHEWVAIIEEELNNALVIAKRHYHQYGVLRWLDIRLVNTIQDVNEQLENWIAINNSSASFVLMFKTTLFDYAIEQSSPNSDKLIWGISKELKALSESAKELAALSAVQKNEPTLTHDVVANNLINERKNIAFKNLKSQIDHCLLNTNWKNSKALNISMTELSSDIVDCLYSKSLRITNEMVNRQKLSAAAVTARRKLIERMIDEEFFSQPDLGFDAKFPPEKAMYLTCIKSLGIHNLGTESPEWQYYEPSDRETAQLFKDTLDYIKTERAIHSFEDIFNFWKMPPYGVTEGLLPLLGMAFFMVYQTKLALYDFDSTQQYIFTPEPDDTITTKIIKKPAHVGIRFTEISSVQPHLLHRLAEIETTPNKKTEATSLAVARALVTFVHSLPSWTKNTLKISEQAIAFRNEALRASDPHKFIYEDLPKLFKIDLDSDTDTLKAQIENVINELKEAYPSMLGSFKQHITNKIGEQDEKYFERCNNVSQIASDFRLKGFAQRCASAKDDNLNWVESLISLLAKTSSPQWTDSKIELAYDSLVSFSKRFFQILSLYNLDKGDDILAISLVSETSGKQKESMINIRISDLKNSEKALKAISSPLKDLTSDERIWVLNELLESEIESFN